MVENYERKIDELKSLNQSNLKDIDERDAQIDELREFVATLKQKQIEMLEGTTQTQETHDKLNQANLKLKSEKADLE